jgi:hypothetical protein
VNLVGEMRGYLDVDTANLHKDPRLRDNKLYKIDTSALKSRIQNETSSHLVKLVFFSLGNILSMSIPIPESMW